MKTCILTFTLLHKTLGRGSAVHFSAIKTTCFWSDKNFLIMKLHCVSLAV